jgi:MSHA biogenesis protein MshG
MPFFAFRGRTIRGDLVQGILEGADTGTIADQLLNTGITPVEIRVSSGVSNDVRLPQWAQQLFAPRIELTDLMLFSRQMYTLLKAGVPILRALAGLEESTQNVSLKRVMQDLRASLDSGRELSSAMRRHPKVFGPFYVSLVRVGEMTGLLENVFLRLSEHLQFEKEMRDRVKSALRYPTIVVVTMAVALVIVNIFVIPAFAKIFASFHAELPLMTRILLGFSDFMLNYWPVMLIAVFGAYLAFRSWVATPAGRYAWDRLKLRIPIAGKIVLKATLARFARSFALSMKSGIPVVQGLTVVADVVENAYVSQRVEQMRDGVERGESVLRSAVLTGIFTPVVLQMVAVGDETGEIDELMFEVAEMYEREVDYELKTLASQIEPLLIVMLGVLILILALGVFLPIWDLGTVALRKGG